MSVRLIISDLHLDDAIPQRTQALLSFINHFRDQISELYILGDLFNYWVGDDHQPECAALVAKHLSTISWVGWIFGNRDFLLGTGNYFTQSKMQPLPEIYKLKLAGKNTILCHGDQLCTDDLQHQRNRQQYVTSQFQQNLLNMSVVERIAIANKSIGISGERKQMLSEDIMDVTNDAVEFALKQYDAELLIHGHTHRPALHQHFHGERMVLGEWTGRGWYIIEDNDQTSLELNSFPIPFTPSETRTLATIGKHSNA